MSYDVAIGKLLSLASLTPKSADNMDATKIFSGIGKAAEVMLEAQKIPEYKELLAVLKEARQMSDQLDTLKAENAQLRRQLQQRDIDHKRFDDAMIWRDLLWLREDGLPRCLYCWEKEQRLFQVVRKGFGAVCPHCQTQFQSVPKDAPWEHAFTNTDTLPRPKPYKP